MWMVTLKAAALILSEDDVVGIKICLQLDTPDNDGYLRPHVYAEIKEPYDELKNHPETTH